MAELGHNKPPDMTVTASETMSDISNWMAEHPVILTEDEAREAKVYIDRGKLCVKDLEDERDRQVRPLNDEVKAINARYKAPRSGLESVIGIISDRISSFIRGEEEKRIKAAEDARRQAEIAERLARDAEQVEREKIEAANAGELGIDVAAAISDADKQFASYQKAERQAAIAEKDTKVRIGGGFTRALSLRGVETLHVTDLMAAVKAMETSDRIVEAVLKAARSYKKVFGEYPPGIGVTVERKA